MSQSARTSPEPAEKSKDASQKPPRKPMTRQMSMCLDAPTNLASVSDAEEVTVEPELSITACIPKGFTFIWDTVTEGLGWDPREHVMPFSVQEMYFEMVQTNRSHQRCLRLDSWVQGLLNQHFDDINEHCDEITSGKVTKPKGNDFILSLTDPLTLTFRRFWVECVIGNTNRHKIARRSIIEFMNVVLLPLSQNSHRHSKAPVQLPGLSVYERVSERITGKLNELLSLVKFMTGMVHQLETRPLEFGMSYRALTRDEQDKIADVVSAVGRMANFSDLGPINFRQSTVDLLRKTRAELSGDRLMAVEARYDEWEIPNYARHLLPRPPLSDVNDLDDVWPRLPGPTEEHQKAYLMRHVYLVERHVRAIWREILLAMEQSLETQTAAAGWYYVLQKRFHETLQNVKDTRAKPDMRLYINLKEARAGRRTSRWA